MNKMYMRILLNILVFLVATACVVAQESGSNETILTEINASIDVTEPISGNETAELVLGNETSETTETQNATETVEPTETTIVCSATQCDAGCSMCRDGSCYAPEVGCVEEINVEKITPLTVGKGEQQLNILIKNTGNVALPYIDADVVGYGVTTLEKMPIESLAAGDKDYTFTKVSITQAGTIDLIVKLYVNQTMVSQNIYQITVTEDAATEETAQTVFNTTSATEKLEIAKATYDQLELIYYEKEKQEYVLYGIKDDLNDIKESLRLAQVAIIELDEKEFDKNMIYTNSALTTIQQQLGNAQKEKKTLWQILYENLAIIGSILGVIISIVTVWSMTKVHLKKARIINVIKGKQIVNIGKKEDIQNIVDKDTKEKRKDL